jgi:hypothetical protein
MNAGTEMLSEGSNIRTTADEEMRADEMWKPRDVKQEVNDEEVGKEKNDEMMEEEEVKEEVQVEVRKEGEDEQYKLVKLVGDQNGHLEGTEGSINPLKANINPFDLSRFVTYCRF